MASERILPPVRLPFTVQPAEPPPAPGDGLPSWGKRLGVWWDDGPEGYGVVVTGTVRSGSATSGLLTVGDRIVAADGHPVGDLGDLTTHLDRLRGGQVQLTVRAPTGAERPVTIYLDPPPPTAGPSDPIRQGGARVPLCGPLESLQRHLEAILSTPRQQEVLPEGIPADPEFGCLGAGLDFAQTTVDHSRLRAAIIANEKRLEDVEIESVEQPDPKHPKGKRKVGIIVRGRYTPTGETVQLEYRFQHLSEVRGRSVRSELAGVDESIKEKGNASGS